MTIETRFDSEREEEQLRAEAEAAAEAEREWEDEEYCPPPITERDARGRFEKRRSGNPRGRPRKRPEPALPGLLGAIMREFDELVPVIKRGKRIKVRRSDLVAKRIVDDLIGEDSVARARAMRLMISLGMPKAIDRVEEIRADFDELWRGANTIPPEVEKRILERVKQYLDDPDDSD